MYKNAVRFSQRFKTQTGRDPSKIRKPPSKATSIIANPQKKKHKIVSKKTKTKKDKNFATLHYIICDACGWKISSRNVQRHNKETCPAREIKPQAVPQIKKKKAKRLEPGTVKCTYCGFIVLEKRYKYHLRKLCSVAINADLDSQQTEL